MRKVAEPDPVQKKLRQDKAAWNKAVSAYINDLIHFKKLMNGWPNKFHQQKSRIIDPVPADPATIIGSLASDFQELVQQGNGLIKQQLQYSQTRRKKHPKKLNLPNVNQQTQAQPAPASVTPPVDLSKQLGLPNVANDSSDRLIKIASNLEVKYDLVSEASNPVSRFFARILNPGFGWSEAARIRRARMQMLSSCAKTYKQLKKLQVQVVRSSNESIDAAWTIFNDDVWKNWNTVRTGFKTFKELMPQGAKDSGGIIKEPKELAEEKKKKEQEAAKLEKKMDQVDQAEQTGKPGPDDAGYQAPPEEETSAWASGANQLIGQTGSGEQEKLASIYLNDYIKNWQKLGTFLPPNGYVVFDSFRKMYEQYDHMAMYNKDMANQLTIKLYKEMLYNLNSILGTSAYSLHEIVKSKEVERAAKIKERDEAIKAQDAAFKAQQKGLLPAPKKASEQLEVVAQDFLKKWIGKNFQKMKFMDDTANVRLQVFEVSDHARESINQIMDHLEKDLNIEIMQPLVNKVNHQLESIRGMMVNLHQLKTVEKKKQKAKGK